jgi:hypothetical protein
MSANQMARGVTAPSSILDQLINSIVEIGDLFSHNGRLRRQFSRAGRIPAAVLVGGGPNQFHGIISVPQPGSDIWELRGIGPVRADRIRRIDAPRVLSGHAG